MFVEILDKDGDDVVVLFKEPTTFDLLLVILHAEVSEESVPCCDNVYNKFKEKCKH